MLLIYLNYLLSHLWCLKENSHTFCSVFFFFFHCLDNDETQNQLSAQIFSLIEHYKQVDPVGLPGAPIPDPFPVPDVKKSIGMGTLTMKNTLAYGFSKFRIKNIEMDLNGLMVCNTNNCEKQ